MDIDYDSSLSSQQRQWIADALARQTYVTDRLTGVTTFVAVDEPPCPGHKDVMCTTDNGDDTYTISIRRGVDDPNGEIAKSFPNPTADIKTFFQECVVHELGHVATFQNVTDDATRTTVAGWFERDVIGELGVLGTLPRWANTDDAWEDRIQEAVAEVFKDAALPDRYRYFDNRTNWGLREANFQDLMTVLKFTKLDIASDPLTKPNPFPIDFDGGLHSLEAEPNGLIPGNWAAWSAAHPDGNIPIYGLWAYSGIVSQWGNAGGTPPIPGVTSVPPEQGFRLPDLTLDWTGGGGDFPDAFKVFHFESSLPHSAIVKPNLRIKWVSGGAVVGEDDYTLGQAVHVIELIVPNHNGNDLQLHMDFGSNSYGSSPGADGGVMIPYFTRHFQPADPPSSYESGEPVLTVTDTLWDATPYYDEARMVSVGRYPNLIAGTDLGVGAEWPYPPPFMDLSGGPHAVMRLG